MSKSFKDLIKDFPPERRERIERRKQELEDQMGVRKVDLTTDEVEYDSSKDEGHDITPPHEYIDIEEPRLEEIQPERWINPMRPDKLEKIVLDDEALAKLREVIGNYNGWDEENQ